MNIRKGISVLLALVSVIALIAGGIGLKNTLAIKSFLEQTDTAAAIKELNTLKDGIGELAANEDAYFSGAKEYDSGLKDYKKGQKDLADGGVQLVQGKKDLVKGQKDYDDGVKQLAAGKKELADGAKQIAAGEKELAEGQKQIDDNTQAYNEGKEQLAQIEPLMPYVDQYVEFRDGNLKALPGFDNAQAWFASVVKPVAKQAGLDIPDDVNDLPGYVQNMVKDGKAQLKEYEDGVAQIEAGKKELADAKEQYAAGQKELAEGEKQLAAGKAQLDQGYRDYAKGQRDYADGQQQLADGAVQLKEGKASLAEFEDGVAQIKGGLKEVMALEPVYSYNKHQLRVASPSTKFGKLDFTKLGTDGKPVLMHNGATYIDLAKAADVANASLQYVDDSSADATAELTSRILMNGVLLLAGLFGLIAGILAFLRGKGSVLATITAVLSIAALVLGIKGHFFDYAYTLGSGAYTGTFASVMTIVMAVCAVLATCYFWPTRTKKAKKSKEIKE